ncbi:hypothetical protein GW17_00040894 [Ensete ventricosum]|nr:hypothetical protein GW17_00040894 [Ensete ventricosum]
MARPHVEAIDYSQGPLQGAALAVVATYSVALTRSGDRLQAQRPWVCLRTRWPCEAAPPTHRGCHPRVVAIDHGQRRLTAARNVVTYLGATTTTTAR